MTLSIDTSKFNISSKAFSQALTRTLNDTSKTVKSEISKEVRSVYNIKKSRLDKSMSVRKAKRNADSTEINVTSKPIGLIHYGATASKAFDKGAKRYFKTSAKPLRKQRKKLIKGAFIAKAKNSNSWQVFRRTTRRGLPIIKVSMISATEMIKKKGVPIVQQVVNDKFQDTFMRNYKFYLNKTKRK